MKKFIFTLGILGLILLNIPVVASLNNVSSPRPAVVFNDFFVDTAMRIDYIHKGNATSESFELSKIKTEGIWPGRINQLTDPWHLGLYFYEVYDKQSGKLIYSQGFCSVFGEWQTTAEAKEKTLPFNESIRIPWPKSAVKVVMSKRDSLNVLHPVWNFEIDPQASSIIDQNTTTLSNLKVEKLLYSGDSKNKVDIVILGDGYTANDASAFKTDAEKFVNSFFSVEPFKSRKSDFNVWSVNVISEKSGIAYQQKDYVPNNPLLTSYNTFGVDRYVLSSNDWVVKDYAAAAPYDFIVILLNSTKYGGGGIFNLYITAAANSDYADYVMVHEMGHQIAGLADEYYQSHVAYAPASTSVEPWEFNVTALLNKDNLKWGDLVTPGTPIPTSWNKQEYENAAANKFDILKNDPKRGVVGAFEGANYLSNGMYRPQVDCIMFSKSLDFCKVCERGLNRVIDLYTK